MFLHIQVGQRTRSKDFTRTPTDQRESIVVKRYYISRDFRFWKKMVNENLTLQNFSVRRPRSLVAKSSNML